MKNIIKQISIISAELSTNKPSKNAKNTKLLETILKYKCKYDKTKFFKTIGYYKGKKENSFLILGNVSKKYLSILAQDFKQESFIWKGGLYTAKGKLINKFTKIKFFKGFYRKDYATYIKEINKSFILS